jgi:hypothetical protein
VKQLTCLLIAATLAASAPARAAESWTPAQYLKESEALYRDGFYFRSARYAFAATEGDGRADERVVKAAYSWITVSLVRAGLYNAASYFFIRTLQNGERASIRRVLAETQSLMVHVGPDLLRKYLIRHTKYEDYDALNRSAYLFSLAKEAVLIGQYDKAAGYVSGIQTSSPLYPFALQLRGTAQAIQGKDDAAISDFRACADRAGDIVVNTYGVDPVRLKVSQREAEDLSARCAAGEARTLYQANKFEDAERAYDRIPKRSFVWPDILFEQAWNAYGKNEYNRTLGKLVSYKSPALKFVFNSEADVLTAQAYLALCLYDDANEVINGFNAKYTRVGEDVKRFVESSSSNLSAFYDYGREALKDNIYTQNEVHRLVNRFVRTPYFQDLVVSEREVATELSAVRRFDASGGSLPGLRGKGFPAFLDQVLRWRVKSARMLGGAFVKNSLLDYHSALINDFEKMAFIKLEMLKRAKDKLMNRKSTEERTRGNIAPSRRDDQYYWSFNGEFWNDELGDYVFGLESECTKG